MFEDEYRREMNEQRASESLISDTLKKMQAEQAKLESDQESETPDKQGSTASPSQKIKRPLFVRVGLPVAACLILVLLGVLIAPQVMGVLSPNNQRDLEFVSVQANTSLVGGIQFGAIDQQPGEAAANLKYAELTESLLPLGLLDSEPVDFWGQEVYLGYDERQGLYYAAFHTSDRPKLWDVLQSTDSDKDAFIRAINQYFSQ